MINDSVLSLVIRALIAILSLIDRHLDAGGDIKVEPVIVRSKVND